MAGAFCQHRKSELTDSGTGDTAFCVRADRGGATHDFIGTVVLAPLHLQLSNGRRAELLLSDEQLLRVLKLLEQPACA